MSHQGYSFFLHLDDDLWRSDWVKSTRLLLGLMSAVPLDAAATAQLEVSLLALQLLGPALTLPGRVFFPMQGMMFVILVSGGDCHLSRHTFFVTPPPPGEGELGQKQGGLPVTNN